MKYPFKEGERYFTIEDHTIVESVWDFQSEEMHTKESMYFKTPVEALYYYRFTRTDEMLHKVVQLLGELKISDEDDDKVVEFLNGYNYFNSMPKFSFI